MLYCGKIKLTKLMLWCFLQGWGLGGLTLQKTREARSTPLESSKEGSNPFDIIFNLNPPPF